MLLVFRKFSLKYLLELFVFVRLPDFHKRQRFYDFRSQDGDFERVVLGGPCREVNSFLKIHFLEMRYYGTFATYLAYATLPPPPFRFTWGGGWVGMATSRLLLIIHRSYVM